MDDGSMWEFAGENGKWVDSVADARPLWSWANRTGSTTITYIATLRKFVMVVNAPAPSPYRPGVSMGGPFDMYFLEADAITGPYRMITYMPSFGPAAYFANIPSKFVANATASSSGSMFAEAYLAYSNWGQLPGAPHHTMPNGSGYKWNMLPIRLVLAPRNHDERRHGDDVRWSGAVLRSRRASQHSTVRYL